MLQLLPHAFSEAAAIEVHVLRAGPGLPRAPVAEDGGGAPAQRLRLRAAREGGAAARGARLAGVQRGRGDGRRRRWRVLRARRGPGRREGREPR